MDRTTDSSALVESASRFTFDLASEADDEQLRELLRATPLGGSIEVTLRREPNYFAAASVEGPVYQVLVVRDRKQGRLLGMGSRSVRTRWIDGQPTPVGYLGGLRLRPEARGGLLLARGYRQLRRLHEDGRAEFYLTTISAGNEPAMRALAAGRKSLPQYFGLGKYYSLVLPARHATGQRAPPGVTVRPLEPRELPALVEFLNEQGRRRLFFPTLTVDDFRGEHPTYRNLPARQIMTAWRGGQIIGVLAAWDQSPFRQVVVERYRGAWRCLRPLYNFFARRRGYPQFPAPGGMLRFLTLALPVVANADPVVFQALLAAIQADELARRNSCLLLGLYQHDPLLPVAKRLKHYSYVTQLFVVCWDEEKVRPERFLGRDLYLELGCL